MEGIVLYSAIIGIFYLLFISIGKISYTADDIAYRLLILIISFEMIMMWLFESNYIVEAPHLMRVNSSISYLLAPSFFLFVQIRLGGKVDKWHYAFHAIPFVFMVCYLMPFYVLSSSEKIDLYIKWRQGMRLDSLPTEAIYRSQQGIYSIWLLTLLIKKWKRIDKLSLLISISFLLIWLISLSRVLFNWKYEYLYIWFHLISFLPILLFFEIRFNSFRTKKKYATSGIESRKSEELANSVIQLVQTEKLYRDPRLSLNKVSSRLDVHYNYVSQAINGSLDMSFNSVINQMRVEEAKQLLADSTLNHLTIEAIAEKAGFNSVSTFNSSFKKLESVTPSQYKRNAQ